MTPAPAGAAIAQSTAQLRYAAVLEWGTRIGFAVLLASLPAYVLGWLPGHVAPEALPQFWSQPVADYLRQTGSPRGWAWLALLHRGDVLGLAGIGILAGCSAFALLALVPLYAARRDRPFVALCLLEILVLVAAASGVLVE
ncbi:hypothetical protein [Ramlibacter sp. AN1133]|uniref:hypothetical protein n=1 Tax=Ramlibacter sp. AN1133 TaxID=3133429 RepID=UPI0030BA86A9